MIIRELTPHILRLANYFPALSITGPRQSGKTTLAKQSFPTYAYVNFEDLDVRRTVREDPRAFLKSFNDGPGVILDEIQQVPELFSYLQVFIDEHHKPGFYILSGSQNFLLLESITQSLAGRVAIVTLLPPSTTELKNAGLLSDDVQKSMLRGWYPAINAQDIPIAAWYSGYITTYLERDVRSVKNVVNLALFQRFLQLCAGRIGQILNITSLANDCEISVPTARGWLSILEASYIVFFLHPHYKNFSKRLIKSPKIYFYDSGLACHLLGIKSVEELNTHYLRGGLFESMVIADIIKQQTNRVERPSCFFWRDMTGHEVDCLIERGQYLFPIEIKSGMTLNQNFFDGLNFWNKLAQEDPKNSFIIYAGVHEQTWHDINIVNWQSCDRVVEQAMGLKK